MNTSENQFPDKPADDGKDAKDTRGIPQLMEDSKAAFDDLFSSGMAIVNKYKKPE